MPDGAFIPGAEGGAGGNIGAILRGGAKVPILPCSMKLKEASVCCWEETGRPREEGEGPVTAGPGTHAWLDGSEGFYRSGHKGLLKETRECEPVR